MDALTLERPSPTKPRVGRVVNRPLRICFLIDELAVAGTESQLLALIRNLDRHRFQAFLCLLRGDSALSKSLEPVECPVMRLGVRKLARPTTIWKMAKFSSYLRWQQIDVVQTYFPDSTYFGMPAAWLAGVPNRVRTRNNLGHWLTPMHRVLGKWCNAITTATLTNCEAARSALIAAERCSAESVHVLENGVDLDRFLDLPPPQTSAASQFIGAVGNLRPVKGIETLVDAVALLARRHADIRIEIAGEGEQRSELQARIDQAALSAAFRLRGTISDVPSFLGQLDIAVLPSRAEGMSNSLLEYMAAGRPIVATDVGGNSELMEHRRHGLLVPSDRPAALADAIEELLLDRALAHRLGAAARERARECFSRKAMIARFERFYLSLQRR